MQITNESDIPLSLAVWLLHDEYDYNDDPRYISVTRLMRPLRHIVLPARIAPETHTADVEEFTSRALGHAIHDSIEKAWLRGKDRGLRLLGYPESVREKVLVNPTDEELDAISGAIPVYLEQRMIVDFDGYLIGGKYDMLADGILEDNKSTSAMTWLFGSRDDEHILQLSLYRWLDSKQERPRVKEDFAHINYIFTDWSKFQARTNPNYPQKRTERKVLQLLSLEETETWVRNKLALIKQHMKTPERDLPECTDEELWRSAPQYKYYADPTKTDGRSTKNFDDLAEANRFWKEAKGGKGIVITKPSEPKRCEYCEAFDVCTQKDRYFS